jgi:methionyl-tRNA formyltransferase
MKNKKIVFMGTPEFAVPTLQLIHKELGVGLVVTVPDKPKGRGLSLQPSEIKIAANKLGIPVLQPESLKDEEFINELTAFKPDIILVVAFRILPKAVYSLASLGSFNVHASLLPKFRGAAPINWTIINGEKETGVTSFLLNDKVDTGTILLQKSIEIFQGFTAGDLYLALKPEAANLALNTCKLLIEGNYQVFGQDESLASPAPKLFPEMCKINWNSEAEKVKNFIHGTSPVPGAWTIWNGKRLKIYRCESSDKKTGNPAEYKIENNNLYVHCLNGTIKLLQIQPEGKKLMTASDFLKGYRGSEIGRFE